MEDASSLAALNNTNDTAASAAISFDFMITPQANQRSRSQHRAYFECVPGIFRASSWHW
jgi:hypothetical protein